MNGIEYRCRRGQGVSDKGHRVMNNPSLADLRSMNMIARIVHGLQNNTWFWHFGYGRTGGVWDVIARVTCKSSNMVFERP